MCAPVVIGMMAIAAVARAYSARQAAASQARAEGINADIARKAALQAKQRGAVAEDIERRKTSILVGRQIALIGSSGAKVGAGTTSLVIADAEAAGELNAIQARNNALREAWGLEAQAGVFDFRGRAALAAGRTQVATSLIGGAASAASAGSSLINT